MEDKLKKPSVLRSKDMRTAYQAELKKVGSDFTFMFTRPAIKDYKHWRVIENDFPYDLITEKHHILVPKRLFKHDWEMYSSERSELFKIKREWNDVVDIVMENFIHTRTFENHYHLHLIKFK